jgi:hypothetical protein
LPGQKWRQHGFGRRQTKRQGVAGFGNNVSHFQIQSTGMQPIDILIGKIQGKRALFSCQTAGLDFGSNVIIAIEFFPDAFSHEALLQFEFTTTQNTA